MRQNAYFWHILSCTALLLLLCGCGQAESTVPSDTAALQTEASITASTEETVPQETEQETTAPEDTTATEPTESKPVQTQPVQTEPTQPVQTEPVQTQPVQTEPTQPAVQIETIQAQPVIDLAVAGIAASRPEAKYDPSWNVGSAVRVPVAPKQSEQAMADTIVQYAKELLSPDREASYTYGIGYQGFEVESNSHIFTLTYSIGEPVAPPIVFDNATVIAQATQYVLSSSKIQVQTFDGSNYTECMAIRDVPAFYNTQDAAQCLGDAVVRYIYTKNILDANYSQFCITFDSTDGASHVFLLYLK